SAKKFIYGRTEVDLAKRGGFAENDCSCLSGCTTFDDDSKRMNYYDNILGLIGHTPLIKLNRLAKGLKPLVLAKMENLNPGFSVKDRIGVSMVEAAEREGKIKPG